MRNNDFLKLSLFVLRLADYNTYSHMRSTPAQHYLRSLQSRVHEV